MPRLKPHELQEARVRSGRLGGRPRKPTPGEARSDALVRLVPKAVRVLEEHLDSGRPDAWRSALRVVEHSWGRPPEHVMFESHVGDGDLDFDRMTTAELQAWVNEARAARAAAAEGGEESEPRHAVVTAASA